MEILVIGGTASGKSEYAETLAMQYRPPRCYIATMMSGDAESLTRIERHQKIRAEKGFITIERYTDLAELRLPPCNTVLLECLGNLVANELFTPDGAGEWVAGTILSGFAALRNQYGNLIVVTNDVFGDGNIYHNGTQRYLETLGSLNRVLAERFDRVIEVVCGIPILLKGGIP